MVEFLAWALWGSGNAGGSCQVFVSRLQPKQGTLGVVKLVILSFFIVDQWLDL